MPSKWTGSAVGFLSLYLVVCVSLQSNASSTFEEYPDEPCTINLILRHFRVILSWELQSQSSLPTNYTLWYTIMSKNEDPKKVENCSDITEPLCDVTDQWLEGRETYVPIIVVHRGDSTVCRCSDYIWPPTIVLEPPEFKIVGFKDHINVTMEFPPATYKIFGESLWKRLGSTSIVIEVQTEDSIRMHTPQMNNVTGNFTYILRDLLPKTNYCVSVYFGETPIIKSPKCTVLQPDQESGMVRLLKFVLLF